MIRKSIFTLIAPLVFLALLLPLVAAAQDAGSNAPDSAETQLEQAAALAAEREGIVSQTPRTLSAPLDVDYPLFVGVDDATVPAYQIDPATSNAIQAFIGAEVWGAAYDEINDIVYFNSGSALYEWPVGGTINLLGTIVDENAAVQSMVGLAFYDGTLYGIKNIANEAVYIINPTTLIATVYIDYLDADFDFGGLAADPNTGDLYATNDDTTPFGSGLFRINLDGSATQIAPYPDSQTDLDGLAVSDDGFAYLVPDEPGSIYVFDFTAAAYTTPLTNPWTTAEVFSGGTWLWEANMTDARLAVAHLAPFAAGAGTAVTITLNSTPVLTNFLYADSTAYLSVPAGSYDVEVFPAGSPTPAITGTFALAAGTDYSVIAIGDGANQNLELLALVDDNSAPAPGNFHLRLGHLAPFAAGNATADVRLQDGTVVADDVNFSDVTPYIPLPAGTYDLKITTPDGATTLIDPLPVTLPAGAIVTAFAVGDGSNQDLGAFAWPSNTQGFLLPLAPVIGVDPAALSTLQLTDVLAAQSLTISNSGAGDLEWDAYTWNPVVAGPSSFGPQLAPAAAGSDGQRGASASTEAAPDAYVLDGDFTEGFDDITNLPGWFAQNNSDPLGVTDWFQGNDTVLPAHQGAPTAYIGANFNNTTGVGTISNWLLTPELTLNDGDTFSFWTRTVAGSTFPDRLELRLSLAGASTNVGTLATDVGDFTTLLLDVNPTLVAGGYPEVWTQFTATLSGIPDGATGRFAFRYFVTNGGPSGANSNYIGIDSVEYVSAAPTTCSAPVDIPWVTVSPITGTLPGGESVDLDVTFDSTGLPTGVYTGTLCINSNDPVTPLTAVPLTMTVADPTYLRVAHLAPFAMDPGTAVTVTVNGAPALTNFAYGDSTPYLQLPEGSYDIAVFPGSSPTPAITATVVLTADTYFSAVAVGDGVNQDLGLLALVDDNTAPAAGKFHLRLGHLAPFAAGNATADVRLQDGTIVADDVNFSDVTAYIPLDAGTYDLKITTPDGLTTLIDPLPVTFAAGDILTAFATGDGGNQPLGVFAWPEAPISTPGFFLPLGYTLYLPVVINN